MKKLFTFIVLTLVVFTIGFISGQTYFNHRKVLDKELFSTIEEERNFLLECEEVKYELILNYDALVDAYRRNDTPEIEYFLNKVDSIYNMEE